MQIVCSLHIQSKYSSGASRNIDIFGLALKLVEQNMINGIYYYIINLLLIMGGNIKFGKVIATLEVYLII
jgi:hypothetical protein